MISTRTKNEVLSLSTNLFSLSIITPIPKHPMKEPMELSKNTNDISLTVTP